jgi:hypothetical protein
MPQTVEKALNVAITVTIADKEDRAVLREDRGTNRQVFAVGGSREITHDRKFQWSGYRGDYNYRV